MAESKKKLDVTLVDNVTFQTEDKTYHGDCVGQVGVETEMRNKKKTCAGVEVDSITKTVGVNVTVTANLEPSAYYEIYDFKTEGLKKDIYGYNIDSKGAMTTVLLVAHDEMENTKKLMIFPKARIGNGISLAFDNDSEDVAKLTLEFKTYPDDQGNFFYEVFNTTENESVIKQALEKYEFEVIAGSGEVGA